MKILFVGHYGGRNIGDEIILLTQMQLFNFYFKEDITFVVYTYDENYTKKLYTGYGFKIETIKAFGLRKAIPSIFDQFKKIKEIDFSILGGGGLIQDVYFSYGIFRYLIPCFIGFKRNVPMYSFSLGVYKYSHKSNRKLFSMFLKYANGISVRDEVSVSKCLELLPNKVVSQVPDSALFFDQSVLKKNIDEEKFNVTIILRDFFLPYLTDIANKVAELILGNENQNIEINIIVFENVPLEEEIALKLKNALISISLVNVNIYSEIDPVIYLNQLSKSQLVISGRLHGIIPSVILEKRIVCLSYSPKIDSFCKERGYKYIAINELKTDVKFADYVNNFKSNVEDRTKDIEQIKSFISSIQQTYNNKPKKDTTYFKRSLLLVVVFWEGGKMLFKHIWNRVSNKKHIQE